MIKINFKYYRDYSQGGKGRWETSFRLFDDNIKAVDLEKSIKSELEKTECGYVSCKEVTLIERI